MTSKATQARHERDRTRRSERDRQRVAELWAEADKSVRELAAMLSEVDFDPRDLDALDELGHRGRAVWAAASELRKITRKVAESG
jgi:hypothetical protein